MSKKRILPELNAVSIMFMTGVASLLLCIPGYFYGPIGLTNPFFIAACSLNVQVLLRAIIFDSEEKKDVQVRSAVMLGPVNLVTGLLILLFALPNPVPSHIFLIFLVTVILGTFLWFGVRDTFYGVIYLSYEYRDRKRFNRLIKQDEEEARAEEELYADVAEFLTGADRR